MPRTFSILLLLLINFANAEPFIRTCEPIRVEMCKGLGYNMTDESQRDAEFFILPFKPLVSFGCSVHLNLFLCSVSVPMCTEKVAYPIGPCRGLCEGVRDRCFPVLEKFGFSWPDALNCSLFPAENNHEHMCMEGPKDSREEEIRFSVDMSFQARDCPPHHARTDSSGPCVPLCDANFLFDSAEKKYAEIWVTVWAIVCFVSSFITALTLSIGGGRVKARPLVSLALCYCFVSAGWILRIITGRNMTSCLLETNPSEFHEDGLANVNCAFVFLLIYYFGMAANAWWVALCAWWFTKAGLSWPPEKLRTWGSYLHIFAWGVPAAQTVGALVKREIDIDELTGTCYVGNKNSSILLSLVLIPQALYLTFGIILLIFGSFYVMSKPQPTAAAPLTGATPRKESDILGALSTLYIIPTACVLVSLFYEYNNKDKWFFGTEKPALWPFLLKHLMSLFVGVSTLFWLWSKKTASAWKGVFKRMGPRKQLPVKCQIPLVTYPQNHYPQHISTTLSTASRHSTRTHPHRKPRIHHHRSEVKTII